MNITLRRLLAAIATVQSSNYYIFCVRVFVALGIQHAKRMLHVVFCTLSGSTIFFHIIS